MIFHSYPKNTKKKKENQTKNTIPIFNHIKVLIN